MGFGGPVWHASASAADQATAWALAERALHGCGDRQLGEWREVGEKAVHLRRRLSDDERFEAGGLVVRDIRNRPEEYERLNALFADAPHLRSLL